MDALPLRIDHASANNLHDVLGLLAEHMPGADVTARFQWLYEKNPHGHAVTVVAYDARTNEAVGVASVFPRKLMTRGRTFLGAIGGDAYVRPVARRRGVATAMHKALLDRMKNEGIDVMFGPPMQDNLRALERAGARVITNVRRYVRPSWAHAVLRPMTRLGALCAVRMDSVADHDRHVETIFARTVDPAHVIAVRDAEYFRWRFIDTPSLVQQAFVVTHERRAIGLCVVERKDKRAAIVDVLAPAEDYARVIEAAVMATEATSFVLQLNEQGPFAREIRRAGMWPRDSKPFQVLAATNHEPRLFDASRWYYTWGDGDLDRVL